MPLLNLSNELLQPIADQFIPAPEGPIDPSSILRFGWLDPEHDLRRTTLVALAKTNKRLNAVANRALYHTILFKDRHDDGNINMLAALLKTLLLHDHLRGLVRVVQTFEQFYNRSLPYPRLFQDFQRVIRGEPLPGHDPLADDDYGPRPWWSRPTWQCFCSQYPKAAFGLLLGITRPEALYLATDGLRKLGSGYPVQELASVCGAGRRHLSLLSLAYIGIEQFVPYCRGNEEEQHPGPHPELLEYYVSAAGGHLRHLELNGAQPLLAEKARFFNPDLWGNLQVLIVGSSIVTGEWMLKLCKEGGARLRAIDIFMPHGMTDDMGGYGRFDDEPASLTYGYNDVLALCADSLEHFRLDMHWLTFRTQDREMLTHLRSMRRLKHLDVEPALIFPTVADMIKGDICDYLPGSLESIQLCLCDNLYHQMMDLPAGARVDWGEIDHGQGYDWGEIDYGQGDDDSGEVDHGQGDDLGEVDHGQGDEFLHRNYQGTEWAVAWASKRVLLDLVLHSEEKLPLLKSVWIQLESWYDGHEEIFQVRAQSELQGLYSFFGEHGKTGTIHCETLQSHHSEIAYN